MSRDISVSKADGKFAYENHNIRIEARDHDTLLSVTNERGNKKIENLKFTGELIGYNVLNEYIILFTRKDKTDRIYRVKYEKDKFTSSLLFSGNLGFSLDNPIESIVSYETPSIQKIYWVDGKNVMRFINFVDRKYDKTYYGTTGTVDTTLDVNRGADFNIDVKITKGNSGMNRPNGVVQYIVTYYNKNGIQTSYVYISDLIYLAPDGRGGSADGHNTNSIDISLSNLDSSFDYVRVYSIVRTSYNGTPSAYIVGDALIGEDRTVSVIDNGAHLEAFDYSELLFLGSKPVVAGTITHKDGTLFLGDLKSIGNSGVAELEKAIKDNAFKTGSKWESAIVEFQMTNSEDENIPYVTPSGLYPYENQLKNSSSRITTFKGGEKYRFALRFRRKDGTESSAMWIGDKVNPYYPMIDYSDNKGTIRRSVAVCNLSSKKDIIDKARKCGFDSVTLCIAKADYSDRSVMAQGVVCPTVFNNLFRCNNAPFLQPSWIFRPRKSNITNRHYSVLKKSSSQYGEIQSNWWEDSSETPTPYYFMSGNEIVNKIDGMDDFTHYKFAITISCDGKLNFMRKWWGTIWIAKFIGDASDLVNVDGTASVSGKTIVSKYPLKSDGYNDSGLEHLRTEINNYLFEELINDSISAEQMGNFARIARDNSGNTKAGFVGYNSENTTFSSKTTIESIIRDAGWKNDKIMDSIPSREYARYTRNLFFVDEHAVTLNSPEIQYEKINIDNADLKFRIVGIARMTGNISDYSIDYSNGHRSGEHVNELNFSRQNIDRRPDGIVSWPLYFESAMMVNDGDKDNEITHPSERKNDPLYDYTYRDYLFGNGISTYMINMWHHSGSIPEMYNDSQNGYSVLDRKVIANLRYSYYTLYNDYKNGSWDEAYASSIRQFNAVGRQLMDIRYDGEVKEYSGTESQIITMPGFNKYPVFMTNTTPSEGDSLSLDYYLRSQSPVSIEYRSMPHAVICFGNNTDGQIVLPKTPGMVEYGSMTDNIETADIPKMNEGTSGPYVPWASALSSGYSIAFFNKTESKSFDVSVYGNYAYMPFDSNMLNALYNAKSAAGRVHIYMLLNIENQKKLTEIQSISGDSFTVGSFSASVNFNRSYTSNNNIRLSAVLSNTSLIMNGKQVASSDYTAVLKVFIYGSWVDASSVDITNADNNPFYSFRIDVTYNDSIYGNVTFSTGTHMEKMVEKNDGTSGGGFDQDDRDEPDNTPEQNDEPAPFSISLLSVDQEQDDVDVDHEEQDPVNPDPDNPDHNPDSDGGLNNLKNTIYTFDESGVSYPSLGRRIRLSIVSAKPFDTSFSDEMLVVDMNSETNDTYSLDNGGVITFLGKGGSVYSFGVSKQKDFVLNREDKKYFGPSDEYLFIGELYHDYDSLGDKDPRYGGIERNKVESNVFIDCSKPYEISNSVVLNGNMGDTYFQRWDCVKTVPYSKTSENGVIDMVSFMVETHVNIDGRTDLDRGTTSLASIDYENFGSLNPVYSQENNFIQSMDTDESFDEDSYETSITWTLEKHDGQEIDPWTHITLSSVLTLDGDKGKCNALSRFSNTIIAFQDRGICEVMFNSRTQLATGNGVPVEIANSGKVDGKRYISNKYGCTNKWSIAEGKGGLYFVDSTNKVIGVFNGESIVPISAQAKFDAWVRRNNTIGEWTPNNRNAFRTFYDKVHSDVYFVNSIDDDNPCLVYNEMFGAFTSFFDYKDVPMMVNVCDRFISYKANCLYLQNEGEWCSIFGEQKPFWMKWKVQPEPYADKIWTNVEYRADFFDNPDTEDPSMSEDYLPYATFDRLTVEDEYQKGEMNIEGHIYPGVEKKFRIWRLDLPRDMNSEFSMDRIRNPWVFLTLRKDDTKPNEMMSLNDVVVKYFSEE